MNKFVVDNYIEYNELKYGNKNISCVYGIYNMINKKMYIGSTENLRNRIGSHKSYLRHNKHDNKYLQIDWNNYQEDDFKFIVLEEIFDINAMYETENKWINLFNFNDLYNLHPMAGTPKNYKISEETRQKFSEMRAGELNPFYGKTHTSESRYKISKSHKGKTISKSQLKGLDIGREKSRTKETYEKIKLANQGEKSGTAKLTEKQAIEILEQIKLRSKTYSELAKIYDISVGQISRIKAGIRWGHLKEIRGDLYE